jgi:hypothetical protein
MSRCGACSLLVLCLFPFVASGQSRDGSGPVILLVAQEDLWKTATELTDETVVVLAADREEGLRRKSKGRCLSAGLLCHATEPLASMWRERCANQGIRMVELRNNRRRCPQSPPIDIVSGLHQLLVELLPECREALDTSLHRELAGKR